jgi:2-polyprenyl-3-methyl-5-hydroxy-6-metoxy-1,4-benzoquinol methylase
MKRLFAENINTPEYWDEQFSKEIKENKFRKEFERFKRTADIIQDGSLVLDLGCGKGEFLEYLHDKKPACRINGVDFSKIATDFAKNRMPYGNFYPINVESVGFYSSFLSKFDYAVSFETLEHLDRPELLVSESYKVLKDGGWLIISTPFENRVWGDNEHIYSFGFVDIVNFFDDRLWELVTLTRYGRDFSNMYVLAKKK